MALLIAAHAQAEQVVERNGVVQGKALVVESTQGRAVALQAGTQPQLTITTGVEALIIVNITAVALLLTVMSGVE
ncbi:hypothetical protein D3C84_1043860 [compost metagenome]